jgi:hypothetical protein
VTHAATTDTNCLGCPCLRRALTAWLLCTGSKEVHAVDNGAGGSVYVSAHYCSYRHDPHLRHPRFVLTAAALCVLQSHGNSPPHYGCSILRRGRPVHTRMGIVAINSSEHQPRRCDGRCCRLHGSRVSVILS